MGKNKFTRKAISNAKQQSAVQNQHQMRQHFQAEGKAKLDKLSLGQRIKLAWRILIGRV